VSLLKLCNYCESASTVETVNLFLNCGFILSRTCEEPNRKKKIWFVELKLPNFHSKSFSRDTGITKCAVSGKTAYTKEVNKLPEVIHGRFVHFEEKN
jgi:hypothetical protein